MKNIVHTYEANLEGRDFVVGDIHGEYDQFMKELEKVNFDKTVDRVFSVGDLVDRGKDSYWCLLLQDESWFHSVMGNHEDMMLNSLVLKDDMYLSNWELNGGGWWKLLEDDQISTCIRIGRSLPMAININTSKGIIGICHAQPPTSDDWDDVHKEESIVAMLWARKKIRNYFPNDEPSQYSAISEYTFNDFIIDKIETVNV